MKRECKLINVLNIGIACFWFLATLLVGVGLSANPAQAQPFAYVTNFSFGTVSVIDANPASADFNKVVSTIKLGSAPQVIAITPDGTRAYVAAGWPDAVLVIDTDPSSTNFHTVIATITIDVKGPYAIAFTPDGTRAYVGNWTNTVSVIDTDPGSADFNKVVSTIEVGRLISGVAITPDGTRAYLSALYHDRVLVIDTNPGSADFNNVVAEIEVPYTDYNHIAITPEGTRVYVTGRHVSVIDTDPTSANFNRVVATIMDVAVTLCGYLPSTRSDGIAITPDGTRAYMTDYCGSSVAVIDTETNTHIDNITNLSLNPISVAITADGSHVYVAGQQTVQMIDTSDNSVVDTIPQAMEFGTYWVATTPSVDTDKDFAAFEIKRARVKLHKKTGRDRFKVVGSFELEAMIDEIDFLKKDVTVTLGEYSETIAGGDFVREDGKYQYKGGSGSITEIKIRDDGRFSVKGKGLDLSSISLDSRVNPVDFNLKMGGYSGKTEIQLNKKGRFRNKKAAAPGEAKDSAD